jgi:hypothetical protein
MGALYFKGLSGAGADAGGPHLVSPTILKAHPARASILY